MTPLFQNQLTQQTWWKPPRELALAALTQVPVMVTATTNTKRRVYARYIHDTGIRQTRPFVAVSCCASPEAEADLVQTWLGRADGGTLFIDDLEGMSTVLQEQLCAALCYPLGTTSDQVAARVITGTGPTWPAEDRRRFSERLYYRLNVIKVDCLELPLDWPRMEFVKPDEDFTAATPLGGPGHSFSSSPTVLGDH